MEHSLIYDKSVLLLPDATTFSFAVTVRPIMPKWNFKIILSDDTSEPQFSATRSTGTNSDTTIILYRWYSEKWVENIEPIKLNSTDNSIRLHIKIRLEMNQYQPQKHLIVSVWKEI